MLQFIYYERFVYLEGQSHEKTNFKYHTYALHGNDHGADYTYHDIGCGQMHLSDTVPV